MTVARFRKSRYWKWAVVHYSQRIHSALTGHKHSQPYNAENHSKEALVCSYSKRAQAWFRLKEMIKAVQDTEKALQLDSAHLGSLVCKGKALHALGEYSMASSCFQQALHQSPTAADEIKLLYQKSKKLDQQNRHGNFDLSAYFLRGCRSQDIPQVSNYIGPVVIKTSPGRGRGLFATADLDIGDTIVVENAVAMSGMHMRTQPFGFGDDDLAEIERLKFDTMTQVVYCAVSSPRIMQQLHHLISPSQVPDMEVFRINCGNWSNIDACKNLQVEMEKLRKSMDLNALLTYMMRRKLDEEGTFDENDSPWAGVTSLVSWGFWALTSFINHSCFANANCMVVGKAMFIIAARKISLGEEVTVSYFKSLLPLEVRQHYFSQLGFLCECRRCMFEQSLGSEYEKIVQQIVTKYARLGAQLPNVSPKDILSLVGLLARLEEVDADNEGKHFIHASFITIYSFLTRFVFPDITVLPHLLPTPIKLAEAIQYVAPGSESSLNQYSRLVDEADGQQKDLLFQKLMEVGEMMIGKQEEHVLKDLVRTKMEGWIKVSKVWDGGGK